MWKISEKVKRQRSYYTVCVILSHVEIIVAAESWIFSYAFINLINTQGAQPNYAFHAQILDNAMCQPTLKLFLLACPCCSQCLVRHRHLLSSIHVFSHWIEKCLDDQWLFISIFSPLFCLYHVFRTRVSMCVTLATYTTKRWALKHKK